MIHVARARDLLIVSSGPGLLYRLGTWAWPALALAAIVANWDASWLGMTGDPGSVRAASVLFGTEVVVMLALLWGWKTSVHRFDRAQGTLIVVEGGPLRAERRRDVLLVGVAKVVDRRLRKGRAIELVLADRTTLVIAARSRGSSVLYARAAEQSLDQYDFGEAVARARKGQDLGATGQTLGVLRSVQASALYSMGRWSDSAAVGYARLWRSVFSCILGDDLRTALALCEEAIRDLDESQVLYRLSLAYIVQSFIWWRFGDLEQSARSARQAKRIAQQINDDYHAALAAWYLSVALAEQLDAASLAEAEQRARLMILQGGNPPWDAVSATVLGRVALARGDWARAEKESRQARSLLGSLPPYGLMASAYLVDALGKQGRWEDACAIAREDLERLGELRGPVCSDVLFRVAAAGALIGGGHRPEADSLLADALRQIELRANKISDPVLRRSYETGRHENRRAAELKASAS